MRKTACLFVFAFAAAVAGVETPLWLDPGPIENLDLVNGPGGAANAPKPPFQFQEEIHGGYSPKVIVSDGAGKKWVMKTGDEAKAELFASRIAWAAGYPVRSSYYVESGTVQGVPRNQKSRAFPDGSGHFQSARFQKFDDSSFHEVKGSSLDLYAKRADPRELNGLKLTALLVANWDVKPANTAVFEIDGKPYGTITDWGASMGDPAAPDAAARKWTCEAYKKRTEYLVSGISNGLVDFTYQQYAGRHEHVLTSGIRVEDMRWYMNRMGKLDDRQIASALQGSGATAEEARCFTAAVRERLNRFQAAAKGDAPGSTEVIRTRTVTKTVKTK